jgi:hypothetical protein
LVIETEADYEDERKKRKQGTSGAGVSLVPTGNSPRTRTRTIGGRDERAPTLALSLPIAYRKFMALIFQVDDEGQLAPRIRCDKCGGIIKNYADGVAVLDDSAAKPGTILEPIFHCGGCEKIERETKPARRSMPIDHFMLYVLNNIQLTPHALEDAGQRLKSKSYL